MWHPDQQPMATLVNFVRRSPKPRELQTSPAASVATGFCLVRNPLSVQVLRTCGMSIQLYWCCYAGRHRSTGCIVNTAFNTMLGIIDAFNTNYRGHAIADLRSPKPEFYHTKRSLSEFASQDHREVLDRLFNKSKLSEVRSRQKTPRASLQICFPVPG